MKELIFGQSGAVAVIAIIMGFVKGFWKPKKKELYWLPAIGLSALASALVTLTAGWTWLGFGAGVVLIAGGQLFLENEAFSGVRDLLLGLIDRG